MAYNEPGGRTDIVTTETPVRRLPGRLRVPPLSVTLYRLAAVPAADDGNLQNGDR